MVVVAAVGMKKVAVVVVRGIGLVMVVMMVGMRLKQQQRGARKWQRRGPREREASERRNDEQRLRWGVGLGAEGGQRVGRLVGWKA